MFSKRSLALAAMAACAAAQAALAGGMNQPHPGVYITAPPPPVGTSYSAVVAANGKLVRGSGAVHAAHDEGKGTYRVTFASDVSGCAYVATVAETGSSGVEPAAAATVVGLSGDATGVYVETFGHNGAYENLSFHLDVGC